MELLAAQAQADAGRPLHPCPKPEVLQQQQSRSAGRLFVPVQRHSHLVGKLGIACDHIRRAGLGSQPGWRQCNTVGMATAAVATSSRVGKLADEETVNAGDDSPVGSAAPTRRTHPPDGRSAPASAQLAYWHPENPRQFRLTKLCTRWTPAAPHKVSAAADRSTSGRHSCAEQQRVGRAGTRRKQHARSPPRIHVEQAPTRWSRRRAQRS